MAGRNRRFAPVLWIVFEHFSLKERDFKKGLKMLFLCIKMGPSYANLFVGFIEELIFKQYSGPKLEFFGRYIDDCFGATS